MAAGGPLSYSAARTYLECPLRYRFLYIEGLSEAPRGYFTFGRTIHSVLEEFVRPLLSPQPRRAGPGEAQRTLDEWHPGRSLAPPSGLLSRQALLDIYDKLWTSEGYLSAEEEGRYRRMGREMLSAYHDAFLRAPPVPVAVEEHLEATWEGIPIHGYVDRIDLTNGGGLEIVDYKTNRELSRVDAEESDQLSIYQVLVEKNYTRPVESLTLYHLRSLTPHRVAPRSERALRPVLDRLGQVTDGIRAEAFDPTPGRQCARCEFRSLCPEFRPVPEEERRRLESLVDRFARLRTEEERLEGELRRAAEELHAEAERLKVHRLPGRAGTAIRRRETRFELDVEAIRRALCERGIPLPEGADAEALRRLSLDPKTDPAVREEIRTHTGREIRWYWELEESGPGN